MEFFMLSGCRYWLIRRMWAQDLSASEPSLGLINTWCSLIEESAGHFPGILALSLWANTYIPIISRIVSLLAVFYRPLVLVYARKQSSIWPFFLQEPSATTCFLWFIESDSFDNALYSMAMGWGQTNLVIWFSCSLSYSTKLIDCYRGLKNLLFHT